jgi:hypothetical protein
MRNLCSTERSLQFSKFTHKSLGKTIPLSSLSSLLLLGFLFLSLAVTPPSPLSPPYLPPSPCCRPAWARPAAGGARAAPRGRWASGPGWGARGSGGRRGSGSVGAAAGGAAPGGDAGAGERVARMRSRCTGVRGPRQAQALGGQSLGGAGA